MGLFGAIKSQGKSLVARITQAAVEGLTFPFGPTGRVCVVVVHGALIATQIGPAKTLTSVLKAVPICAAARAGFFFIKTLPQKVDADQEALDSIWDFDPPGELGESGAWQVVRELAVNMSKGGAALPDEDMETLPFHELAVRLCFLFDDGQNNPDVDEGVKGGKVDDALKDTLAKQMHYANLVYEGQEDPGILDMLKEDGFGLSFFKPEAEWESGGAHKPAFYVATNNDTKQMLVSIRGTSEMHDVMADIIAVPEEYDGTGRKVHQGMGKAAEWMLERILPLAQALDSAGYTIVATGHSLGGATAALLCLSLKRRGFKRVQAYGFGTPACAERELAEECREFFTDVVYRDDVVSRFGPDSLSQLHKDLREYDWEEAAKERGPHNPMLGNASKLAKLAKKLSSWKSDNPELEGEERDKQMQKTEDKLKEISKVMIPGKVVFCYRAEPDLKATEPPALQLALVDGSCPQLHRLHINAFMVADHTIPCFFTALGRPNPVEERRKQQEREQQEKEEKESREESEEEEGEED